MDVEAPRIAKSCNPGQFIIAKLDEKGERIPLTICDYDRENGTITIVFQVIGASTEKMSKLKTGDAFRDFTGPLGQPSEFVNEDLEELKKTAKIMPMVNQVEIHPFSTKNNIINYCKDNNIKVVAWSPISRGRVLSNDLMIDLSQKYKKSIVQIVLRWHMQKGVIPIPKSSNENRIKENMDIFDFEISSEDMKAIDSLDEGDDMSVTTPPLNTIYEEVR